ncbi:2-oxo-4-hydroxy-4-carboxy-5-ureidoimidazoline decarboxylase [Solicola gregarius]|uniref:2-oxo-4-hydroxy-4-carboxy-5-ureidoimidazoline decarboxylase n=1 Tax=Solicola gregarius TaxID=2908642 RepID=A0AA46TJC0_9ACTN|nr:2-oxo-4-hydroxy-4-carboxy-5-ureidoimidazoline decarboxylase [Solicola gregarius]UYM05543.1 2-oxo-4-hydroxy-4-carboxy-5-ureidoimidazoline decarboxylase [Solicola gregarius]
MPADGLSLDQFNALPAADARLAANGVCASAAWAEDVIAHRPYADVAAVLARSDDAVFALDDIELGAALAGHPRIGDRPTGAHAAWSRREQASMSNADADVAERIRAGNLAYEERFGHVYLVCASGRSPEELLSILESRLDNAPAEERAVVLSELAAINRLRLGRLVA